ncbi:MAG: peptide chain release factor 1 [Planctomycetota bacterium]|nr:MAG: peptide chain release factor 1 [Planctomycetota bacterium]
MSPALQELLKRYEELERQLMDPAVLADPQRLVAVQREHGSLAKPAARVREYNALLENIAAAEEMLAEAEDQETRQYAQSELATLRRRLEEITEELEEYLLSGDSLTRSGLIMEIRAGTGGDEAALFARDLFQMYQKYVDRRGWESEIIDLHATELGGIREVVFSVRGEGAYHALQFESGGHRVQRVPETEAQGRIHTSAATVAVLPEATDVEVHIDPEDLRIDRFHASGPGGQKVNKTESAIRITHLPTGIVVQCQDEKSQHKNKAKAMRVLRSRILQAKQREAEQQRADQRRTLIGSGDRSERIRTYNFPQNRVTDHRIGLTLYKLDQIMQGDLDELIRELIRYDKQERLRQAGSTSGTAASGDAS